MPEYSILLADNLTCSYKISPSTRAKYLRIKLMSDGKVRVVLPVGVKEKLAHAFILEQKQWLYKHLLSIKKKPIQLLVRPNELSLNLLNEIWQINYEEKAVSGATLKETGVNELTISGEVEVLELVFKMLSQWLKFKAQSSLPKILSDLAAAYHFHYGRVTIRQQKTLWGSCSSKGNISLNCKLLFFPEDTVKYVLIHELCHTRELNHSKRFWMCVAECDPSYKWHEKVLKQARDYVPAGF